MPPLASWASGFGLKITWFRAKNGTKFEWRPFFCSSPDLGRKMGRNLSEDLFFCSSPDFGRKMGRNLGMTISNSDLCSSQVFWSFCPPPFSKSCVRYWPRAKREPGVSSNIRHLRFCVLQNRRGKCHNFLLGFDVISKKKRSSIFHKLIRQCQTDFDGPSKALGPSDGPPKVHGPRGHCPPLSVALVIKRLHCDLGLVVCINPIDRETILCIN